MKCAKVRYRNNLDARIALAKLRAQDKSGHTERRAYRCPECKAWHLTSKGKRT
jgi:hypothetical protein